MLAALTTAGVMTWTEATATPMRDIYTLHSILVEWDQQRRQ